MAAVPTPWFPPVAALPFAETLALIIGSMVRDAAVQDAGGRRSCCRCSAACCCRMCWGCRSSCRRRCWRCRYVVVGWTIGLRFTREILMHAARALPAVIGSLLALLLACGVFAVLLVMFAGVDPLTAYLATSPGGADSVAIIAASSKVDVPFVMAMQAGRFIVVLLTGPALARFIATRSWMPKG